MQDAVGDEIFSLSLYLNNPRCSSPKAPQLERARPRDSDMSKGRKSLSNRRLKIFDRLPVACLRQAKLGTEPFLPSLLPHRERFRTVMFVLCIAPKERRRKTPATQVKIAPNPLFDPFARSKPEQHVHRTPESAPLTPQVRSLKVQRTCNDAYIRRRNRHYPFSFSNP